MNQTVLSEIEIKGIQPTDRLEELTLLVNRAYHCNLAIYNQQIIGTITYYSKNTVDKQKEIEHTNLLLGKSLT